MPDTAPLVETLTAIDPGFAITVDDTIAIGEAPFAGTVTAVTFTGDAAITGAATNHRALRLINKGQAGVGTAIVAELAFDNGINLVAFDEKVIPLSATPANLVVAAGDQLALFSEAVGTGLVDPGGTISVDITRS